MHVLQKCRLVRFRSYTSVLFDERINRTLENTQAQSSRNPEQVAVYNCALSLIVNEILQIFVSAFKVSPGGIHKPATSLIDLVFDCLHIFFAPVGRFAAKFLDLSKSPVPMPSLLLQQGTLVDSYNS